MANTILEQYEALTAFKGRSLTLTESFNYCEKLAKSHYENFTVGSFLIPKKQRQHIYNVYAFCRWADDLGDESKSKIEAVKLLEWWEKELENCYNGKATHPVFIALSETIKAFNLPINLFKDLIFAFKTDQTKTRYETFEELCQYAKYSANPVGRIYLLLFGCNNDKKLFSFSDATCTALQLTNFWQDVTIDWEKGRVYLPQEELRKAGYSEEELANKKFTPLFQNCMASLVSRTQELFFKGLPLLTHVKKDVRLDIELFSLGGLAILKQIEAHGYDVLSSRPVLNKWEKLRLLLCRLLGLSAFNTRHNTKIQH